MKSRIYDRLLRRELGASDPYAGIRGLYGDRIWVDEMDIVNELGGHTGCVNALQYVCAVEDPAIWNIHADGDDSWSSSGSLLASGSDDMHVNIFSYQPESSISPFSLNTTIHTGHTANIFSVKFMPHSNDRTLVSCAGDSEVRVFDIEYSNRSASSAAESARSRRFNNFFNGMWYLTDKNTNCRVYKSHADRVKRIVTESSPHLFLTCSEDGEVRQWDLRQPSSAYPSPRGGQGFMAYRPGLHHDDSNVPPPLISYKKHHIDLNTMSCAASQPHYIALGGAHLHCFLHDRRMMGRDLMDEKGQTGSPSSLSDQDDETMGKATRCVRRFAPNGQKAMRKRDSGHITACKISNANPNEMVVSWSGDHIYNFDLIRSSDARDGEQKEKTQIGGSGSGRAKMDKNRKRKRGKATSAASAASATRRQSRRTSEDGHVEEMSLRVRYGNGGSEDIPLDSLADVRASDVPGDVLERARESVLNEAQKLSLRIAKGLVEIRKLLFSVERTLREAAETQPLSGPTPYTTSFTSVLGYAANYLPEMDEVIRTWRYPLSPSHDDVLFQQALRRNRETSRRFVQASGTLARVLGGRLNTASGGESPHLSLFRQIVPAPTEDGMIDPSSRFGYDFLKGILLWLEGGRPALLDGFKRHGVRRRDIGRFPLLDSADDSAIEETLIPYFRELAGTEPVVNVDASVFEHDGRRVLFQSQADAVEAFAKAIRIPLEDLGDSAAVHETEDGSATESQGIRALDKNAAIRFWGLKVGRGILMEVGEGVNFEFTNRAFGGLRTVIEDDEDEDDGRERIQEDINPDEEEEPISEIRLVRRRSSSLEARRNTGEYHSTHSPALEPTGHSNARVDADTSDEDEDYDHSDTDSEGSDNDDEGDHDADSSDDEHVFVNHPTARQRREVETRVPCSSHINVYRGHCNVKTVKDVNFFGLNDEYVVSGSDCGNVFIWDRKTSDLVNILTGDSEVVNVVQGHPYEPTLAVSGIDHTIKIFSPDARAQHDAKVGINIADPDAQANIVSGNTPGGNRTERNTLGLRSRRRMQDSYQIMSENDVNRQGGMNEAFITVSAISYLFRPSHPDSYSEADGAPLAMASNIAAYDQHLLSHRERVVALLRTDTHNPLLHLELGKVHVRLGFPDLAAADAYRALTLFEHVLDPHSEYVARKRIQSALTRQKNIMLALGRGDSSDNDSAALEDDAFEDSSWADYKENIGDVYILLVEGLVLSGCMKDAFEFCMQGIKLPHGDERETRNEILEKFLSAIKRSHMDAKSRAQEGGSSYQFDAADLRVQGYARRVVYPWNTHEPDRRSPEIVDLLNARLQDVAPKCEVRSVGLPALHGLKPTTNHQNGHDQAKEVSVQLGLFAKEDIAAGEVVLHESSMLTATNRLHDDLCDACNSRLPQLDSSEPPFACEDCEDTVFCSESCYDIAYDTYHRAICGEEGLESIGKDIPDPKDKADYLYLLLLARSMAMAQTQGVHPLDLPEVKYIWGDFHTIEDNPCTQLLSVSLQSSITLTPQPPSATLPFSFQLNILQPMRIVEEMGLDPFDSLATFDTWIYNTLYAKFRGTASGRLSTWDGGPEVCAVHPLWCLANHSCDPNVRWEWGGEITFKARNETERVQWGGKQEQEERKDAQAGNIAIRKDEEILNHYCDLGLVVKERREWAMGALGGPCQCCRCTWEELQP
ncbi:hypothetical protein LOZ53_006038 [Ophidiomyces ophidiicola]|nr:hypothetical protein LOZ55_004221 [Ophidiomyces ophidiicola]KAI1980046.1 hypothetical protein LOZ54_005937 [Ophidiomyces ophidiicola]KAI1983065.1 hypothetical protein LOZ53_006038 [Ophidiomyces ophidiicola]